MGNNNSSRLKTEIEWPRNEYGYLKTKIAELDGVFTRAGKVFDEFENYRISIKQKIQRAHELAGTDQLENPSLIDPLRIMLWSYSAACEGKLKLICNIVTDPIVKFEIPKVDGISDHTWELYQACNDLLVTFSEASNMAPSLANRTTEIFQEIAEVNNEEFLKIVSLENGVARQDLDWLVDKNADMFTSVYNIMFTWNDIHLKMGEEYTSFVNHVNAYVKEADVIGKEAVHKHVKHPKEILVGFQHYL